MKKFYILILLVLSITQLSVAQTCIEKKDKSFYLNEQINDDCSIFTARDEIELGSDFVNGHSQKTLCSWTYSTQQPSPMSPEVVLNGNSFNSGASIPWNDTYVHFQTVFDNLVHNLTVGNDNSYTFSISYILKDYSSYSEYTANLIISKFAPFTCTVSGIYVNSVNIVQAFEAKNSSFTARIDKNQIDPVDYWPSYSIPDADNRILDKTLVVGTTTGSPSVSPSGASTYNIPINVPAGLGNMVPQISVGYNSQGGNGLLGWGWNLGGLSAITRVGQTIYSDGLSHGVDMGLFDKFALDGNKLIANGTGLYGVDNTEYSTEVESFSKIISHGNYGNGPAWFEVQDKNGNKYKYGSSTGRNSYGKVPYGYISWYLDYAEDALGNFMSYTYETVGMALYIKKITFGCNVNNNTQNYNTIEFFYEQRNDILPIHHGVINDLMDRVLNKIVVKNSSAIYRQYSFDYINDEVEYGPFSRLYKITESDSKNNKYNPTIIKWGKYISSSTSTISPTIELDAINANDATKYWTAGDVDNDGKDELICIYDAMVNGVGHKWFNCYKYDNTNGTPNLKECKQFLSSQLYSPDPSAHWRTDYAFNGGGALVHNLNGDNIPDIVTPMFYTDSHKWFELYVLNKDPNAPTFAVQIDDANTEIPIFGISDLDNNGIEDIVFLEKASDKNGLYHGKIRYGKEGAFTNNGWTDFNLNISNPQKLFLADFDGDGLNDVMIVGDLGYTILFNKGGIISISDFISSDKFNSSYSCIRPGDFNGDGIIDLILCENNSRKWKLALNDGSGNFNFSTQNIAAQQIGTNDPYDNTIVTDFNNDGKSDVIVFDNQPNNFTTTWYKSTGTGFELVSQAISPNATDAPNSLYTLGDFNGDGRTDLANFGYDCSRRQDLDQKWHIYSTPNTNNNAGLITTITNGLNIKCKFNYKPLTDNSIYSISGTPQYPLRSITGPLYVVDALKIDNGLGGQSNVSYTYDNALVNVQGKGFLGFALLVQTDNVSNMQTRIASDNWPGFDPPYYTMNSQTTQVWYIANQVPVLVSKTTNDFGIKVFSGKHIFNYLNKTTSINPLTNATVTKTILYDGTTGTIPTDNTPIVPYNGHGNIISEDIVYGDVNKRTDYVTSSYKEYIKAASFIENKPQLIQVEKKYADDPSSYTSSARFVYDPVKGYVNTKTDYEELASGKKVITTYIHDPSFGVLTSESTVYPDKSYNSGTKTFSDISKTKAVNYQYTADGKFVTKKNEKLNGTIDFSTENSYDAQGNLLTQKSPSGFVTTHEYNAPFNSLSKTINPDKTWMAVTTGWADPLNHPYDVFYTMASSYGTTSVLAASPTTRYFDLMGRELRTESINFKNKTIVSAKSYNAKGQTEWETLPYYSGETPVKKYFTYDAYGRIATQYYDVNEQLTTYTYDDLKSTKVKIQYPDPLQYSEKTTDVWGNVKLITDAKGNNITYTYNSRGVPVSINSAGITSTMKYDDYGNQIELNDPSSAGKRSYLYNSIGKLYQQTDEKGSKIISSYDDLGRITTKYIGSEIVNYTYDTYIKGILYKVENITNGTARTYSYDVNNGRLLNESEIINNKTFSTSYTYNSYTGALLNTTYPSGFVATNVYDTNGNLTQIKSGNASIWQATDENALGGITAYTMGANKHNVTKTYDKYGTVTKITVPNIMDLEYKYYDITRNLEYRKNNTKGLTENFTYDELNRLKTWGTATKCTLNYSGVKIDNKSDAGTGNYAYLNGTYKVSSLPGAILEMRKPANISYNDMNKISHIDEYNNGTTTGYSMYITYDCDEARKMEVLKKDNITTLLTRYYVGGRFEQEERGTSIRQIDFITGASAIHVKNGGLDTIYYLHTDNQGSWLAVTNDKDATVKEQAFDPWGRRRNPTTWALDNATNGFPFARGYTGHEHMDAFGLINMNGRVYDPILGVFLSADNYVQQPSNSQNFNRYTYCLNNPLMYTDPTGDFFWMPVIIGAVIGGMMNGMQTEMNGGNFWDGAWKGAIVGAVGGALGQFGGGTFLNNVVWGAGTGAVTGGLSAGLNGGDIGKGMLYGAAIGGAFAFGQSTIQSINNYHDYGMFGTNDGVFNRMSDAAFTGNPTTGTYTVDPVRAQKALDFWQARNGGPSLSFAPGQSNGNTDVYGKIKIGEGAFVGGHSAVREQISHEMGHYIKNVNWDNGAIGGRVSNPHFINTSFQYGGDGIYGYNGAIEGAGNYHTSLKMISNGTYYRPNTLWYITNPYRSTAWQAYGWEKWFYLIPRRF